MTGERERLAAEHRVEMVVVEREAHDGVRSIGRWRLRLHGSSHLIIERTTDGATVLHAVAVLVHARQDATIGAGRDDLGLIGVAACFPRRFGLHGLVATGIIAIGKAARLGIDINRADGHLPLIAIVAGGRRLGEGVLLGGGQTTLSIVAHARTIMSTRPGTVDIRRGRGDGTPCAAVEAGCTYSSRIDACQDLPIAVVAHITGERGSCGMIGTIAVAARGRGPACHHRRKASRYALIIGDVLALPDMRTGIINFTVGHRVNVVVDLSTHGLIRWGIRPLFRHRWRIGTGNHLLLQIVIGPRRVEGASTIVVITIVLLDPGGICVARSGLLVVRCARCRGNDFARHIRGIGWVAIAGCVG